MSEKEIFEMYAAPVMELPEWGKCAEVRHHHFTNVQAHSEHVGVMSVKIAEWFMNHFHQNLDLKTLCIAAAGHDLGMAGRAQMSELTLGWKHPLESYRILKEHFGENRKLRKIVKHHMWPLCVIPPVSREGWILTLADKVCAVEEKFGCGIPKESFVPAVK